MEQTDAALVEQCLCGRRDAFSDIVKRHQDSVFNLALRMTGNRDDAADLAQETFIRAYRKLRSYDSGYTFRNWLLSICANLSKNYFRSEARRHKAHEVHAEMFSRNPATPDHRRAAVEEALKKIPEALRIPLVMKHVEGLSYEEVARILKIGVSAAKMRVKRGRDELVRLFNSSAGSEAS